MFQKKFTLGIVVYSLRYVSLTGGELRFFSGGSLMSDYLWNVSLTKWGKSLIVLQLCGRVLWVRLRLKACNWIKQNCILFRSCNIAHPMLNRDSSVVATLELNMYAILEFLIHSLTNKFHAWNSLKSLVISQIVHKFPSAYNYRTEGLALTGKIKVNYVFQIQWLTLRPLILFPFPVFFSSLLLFSVFIGLQSVKIWYIFFLFNMN